MSFSASSVYTIFLYIYISCSCTCKYHSDASTGVASKCKFFFFYVFYIIITWLENPSFLKIILLHVFHYLGVHFIILLMSVSLFFLIVSCKCIFFFFFTNVFLTGRSAPIYYRQDGRTFIESLKYQKMVLVYIYI